MNSAVTTPKTDHQRAQEAEATFRLGPGLYLLGSLERGVTVYSQQVRAHNLVWALWELQPERRPKLGSVAVVGGGVAGLTVAACLLSLADEKYQRHPLRAIVGPVSNRTRLRRPLVTSTESSHIGWQKQPRAQCFFAGTELV